MNNVTDLQGLIASWMALEGRALGEAVLVPELLSTQAGGATAHLAMGLRFPDADRYFYIDFWAREVAGGSSPVTMLNTRVTDVDGKARDLYAALLRLLVDLFPPRTLLVTFVRQRDSLQMLEVAAGKPIDPQMLPIVQLFEGASWKFLRLDRLAEAQNPRRRHLIRFETVR